MGTTQTKQEDVVIAQTASGGSNSTSVPEEKFTTTNVLLGIITAILILAAIITLYRLFKRSQEALIDRRITLRELQRSFRMRRGTTTGAPSEGCVV